MPVPFYSTEKLRREPADASDATVKLLRRGWRIGAEDFADRLAQRFQRRGERTQRAEPRREMDERLAERIVRAGLARHGWKEGRLRQSAKADPVKIQIAHQVRVETPVTLAWIAARLKTGSVSYLAVLLARQTKNHAKRLV